MTQEFISPYIAENGLKPTSLDDLLKQCEVALKNTYGYDINLDTDSPLGQLYRVLCTPANDLRELLYDIATTFDPDTARETYLSRLCAITGTTRRVPKPSKLKMIEAYASFANFGQILKPGIQAHPSNRPDAIFATDAHLTFDTVSQSIPTTENFYAEYEDKKTELINITENPSEAFKKALNKFDNISLIDCGISDNNIKVIYKTLNPSQIKPPILIKTEEGEEIESPLSSECWAYTQMTSLNNGEIKAPYNSDWKLIGTIPQGLKGFRNNLEAELGVNPEPDHELRIRREQELRKKDTSSIPGIRRTLAELPGVKNVIVRQNRSTAHDKFLALPGDLETIPPNHIAVIVQGGEDAKIAETLFQCTGGGVHTYAKPKLDTSGRDLNLHFVTHEGYSYEVRFSRPETTIIELQADLFFPYLDDGLKMKALSQFQKGLDEYAKSLENGEDIKIFTLSKYINIDHLTDLEIKIRKQGSSHWQSRTVKIGISEVAQFSPAHTKLEFRLDED